MGKLRLADGCCCNLIRKKQYNRACENNRYTRPKRSTIAMSSQPLYPAYLPTRPDGYQPTIDVPYFEGDEPGKRADHTKPSFYKSGANIQNLTPRVGVEVRGLQLSSLSEEGLDELALLAAERGVVVFVSVSQTFSVLLQLTVGSGIRILPILALTGRKRL